MKEMRLANCSERLKTLASKRALIGPVHTTSLAGGYDLHCRTATLLYGLLMKETDREKMPEALKTAIYENLN